MRRKSVDKKMQNYHRRLSGNICSRSVGVDLNDLNKMEKAKNKVLTLGPRISLYDYKFNQNFSDEEAIKMVLEYYPNYTEEVLKTWLEDKKAIEKWKLSQNLSMSKSDEGLAFIDLSKIKDDDEGR